MVYKDGILLVNKKSGITSYDIIRKLKKETNYKLKIGHAGTLDPLASGLMIILLGKATKLSSILINLDKKYEGLFQVGIMTDTGDMEGKIIEENKIDLNNKVSKLNNYTYNQVPPKYSSKKINGQKAYDLARENIDFSLMPNKVLIKSFIIKKEKPFHYNFKSYVSKGTYIRTLVEDFAKLNGTIATLTKLKRTEIGPFKLENATKYLSIYETLKLFNIKDYTIKSYEINIIKNANTLNITNKENHLIIKDKNNNFLAFYKKIKENIYKPVIII